jgi:drug/metabolite transporter (DMT)-like permease
MNKLEIASLILLSFTLITAMPVLNKELYRIIPFPLHTTAIQMSCSILPALFIGWAVNGFPSSFNWFTPPHAAVWYVFVASLSHGLMILSHNVGLFISDWDFAIIFKFTGIVSQAIFACLFLQEKLSFLSSFAIVVVLAGTYLLTAKFEFSTAKVPSTSQIGIQFLVILFQTVSHISMKKALNILKASDQKLNPLSLLAFRYSICQLPIYVTVFLFQKNSWGPFFHSINQRALVLGLIGIVIGQLSQIVMISLANNLTVLANAIASQLRAIPALIVSHVMYHASEWSQRQYVAFLLVSAGTFLFSWSRRERPSSDAPESSPTKPFATDDDGYVECDVWNIDSGLEAVPKESQAEFKPGR